MSSLRVGFDVSPLRQTRAGTARYIEGLIRGLERQDLELRRYSFAGGARWLVPALDVGWYLAGLPVRAQLDRADVLHCPSFRAPIRSRVPLVVTFHDLAVLRYPEAFNGWTRHYSRLLLPHVARSATKIVAVSEFTRRELVELLDVPERKIRVIPNGVDEKFTSEGPTAEGNYVLAVGTLEPRKNLARLAEAVDGRLELRVVGARGWGGIEPPAHVRWLGDVPDEELARLYRGAACLAYPSLYEGFGLPVAEAMACGCPVVTSRGTAMEEVAGGYAVYVDPLDVGSIREGLDRAAGSRPEPRLPFSWEDAAAATAEVYREVAA